PRSCGPCGPCARAAQAARTARRRDRGPAHTARLIAPRASRPRGPARAGGVVALATLAAPPLRVLQQYLPEDAVHVATVPALEVGVETPRATPVTGADVGRVVVAAQRFVQRAGGVVTQREPG